MTPKSSSWVASKGSTSAGGLIEPRPKNMRSRMNLCIEPLDLCLGVSSKSLDLDEKAKPVTMPSKFSLIGKNNQISVTSLFSKEVLTLGDSQSEFDNEKDDEGNFLRVSGLTIHSRITRDTMNSIETFFEDSSCKEKANELVEEM